MNIYYDYDERRDYEKGYCREEKKCEKHNNKKCQYHDGKCCDEHKYDRCCPKNPCPYPILFECGQGTGAMIPGGTDATTPFTPRALGCLTIDTTCLESPVVKFDFTSIVKFVNTSDNGPARLTFGLFKKCDSGEESLCGTWDFAIDFDGNGEQVTTSYSFSYCECHSCPGCCTYAVRVIAASNSESSNTLDICNTTLSAIAKSAC